MCGEGILNKKTEHCEKVDLERFTSIRLNFPSGWDEYAWATEEGLGGKATHSKYHSRKDQRKDLYTECVDRFGGWNNDKVEIWMCPSDADHTWRIKAEEADKKKENKTDEYKKLSKVH